MSGWAKVATGYTWRGHRLERDGRLWTLTLANGERHELGKRASFDHAEGIISQSDDFSK